MKDKAEIKGTSNKAHDRRKSDPTHWDTDRGNVSDGKEIAAGADPSLAASYPSNPRTTSG